MITEHAWEVLSKTVGKKLSYENLKELFYSTGIEFDRKDEDEHCQLCGQNIRFHFEIKNKINDKKLLVGSSCILKFNFDDIDEEFIERVKKERNKNAWFNMMMRDVKQLNNEEFFEFDTQVEKVFENNGFKIAADAILDNNIIVKFQKEEITLKEINNYEEFFGLDFIWVFHHSIEKLADFTGRPTFIWNKRYMKTFDKRNAFTIAYRGAKTNKNGDKVKVEGEYWKMLDFYRWVIINYKGCIADEDLRKRSIKNGFDPNYVSNVKNKLREILQKGGKSINNADYFFVKSYIENSIRSRTHIEEYGKITEIKVKVNNYGNCFNFLCKRGRWTDWSIKNVEEVWQLKVDRIPKQKHAFSQILRKLLKTDVKDLPEDYDFKEFAVNTYNYFNKTYKENWGVEEEKIIGVDDKVLSGVIKLHSKKIKV